jgi:hypothetical protein
VRARGAATIESMLVLALVLLPLLGALFELTQLGVARQLLQAAAFDATRAAAVAQGDREVLLRVLARGLVPLHGRASGTPPATAFARALVEAQRPDLTRIEFVSPTRAAFDDHAVPVGGDRWLPNAGSDLVAGRGARSGLSLAEANGLVVRVRYCQRLVVPLLDRMIAGVWQRYGSPEARGCLLQRRIPIVVEAMTVMQSPASAARMGWR